MLNRLFQRFGKRNTLIGAGVLFVVIVGGVYALSQLEEPELAAEDRLPAVKVARVGDLSGDGQLSLVGTVASVSEVKLESEASGRVTRVYVKLGDTVRPGTTIATIENGAERAALLQAEGSYEAAVAAAAKSDISVTDTAAALTAAKQDAVDTVRSSLASWTSVLYNTVDELFTNPRIQNPGVRISADGYATALSRDRYALNELASDWEKEAAFIVSDSNTATLNTVIDHSLSNNAKLSSMVDLFIQLLARVKPDDVFTTTEIARLQSEFSTAKSTLNTNRSDLEAAKTALFRAEEALNSAKLGGTQSEVSSANAAVKQALGALRAAQVNYRKTVITTPIGGTVNTLSIKAGEYVTQRTPVANIGNNNALEVTTYIGENDRGRVRVGSQATINGTHEGVVTAIAPGVDPTTKKVEVKISAESKELISGDTVNVTIEGTEDVKSTTQTNSPIIIPVSALKVGTDKIVVFTVSSENTLIAHDVIEGPLQGVNIVIESGLTPDMEIVTDARGLNTDDKVNVLD